MIISENKIRELVRNSILKEITQPRFSSLDSSIAEASRCDYASEIPAKFAKLFSSTTAQEFVNKLSDLSPRLKNDLNTLDIGSSINNSGIVNAMDPSDISSVIKSDNVIQIIASYFNSYLYGMGFGCLGYYYLNKLLEIIGLLLGDKDASDAAIKGKETVGKLSGSFEDGIYEKANLLAKSNSDAILFKDVYCFYSFENLSKDGPNSEDIEALIEDLSIMQQKIDEVLQVNEKYPKESFKAVCRILRIKDTIFYQQNVDNIVNVPSKTIDLNTEFKKRAVTDLLASVNKSRVNFKESEENNFEFKNIIKNFFSRNTR